MRFLLVSTEDPNIKSEIEIPSEIVKSETVNSESVKSSNTEQKSLKKKLSSKPYLNHASRNNKRNTKSG